MKTISRLLKDLWLWAIETLWFIPYAITDLKNVAAILPTPPWTCRRLMMYIPQDSKIIIEWGPGIGTITETMLTRIGPDAKLITYEINSWLAKYLGKRFKGEERLDVRNKNAAETDEIQAGTADVIISGIPFTFFTQDFALELLEKAQSTLKEGGIFIAYQYRGTANSLLRQVFDDVKSYGNKAIPPMWITIARKDSLQEERSHKPLNRFSAYGNESTVAPAHSKRPKMG